MKSPFGPHALAVCVLVLLGALTLQAANGPGLHGPVLGYLFDAENGVLHRVNGIPGASSIGPSIDVGVTFAEAIVSPNLEFAIAWNEEQGFMVVDLTAVQPVAVALEGALNGVDGVLFSPSGDRAALYDADAGAIQLLEDLPGSASVGDTLELAVAAGAWTALAISDAGVVLAASSEAGGGSLFMLRSGSASVRIGSVQNVSDLAFLAGSNDAIAADSGASEVIFIRDVVTLRQFSVLSSASDHLGQPFEIAATVDGSFVVGAVAGGVAIIPVAGGVPFVTSCACAPTILHPLAGGNVFQLTEDIRVPVQVVEISAEPNMAIIPALAESDVASNE